MAETLNKTQLVAKVAEETGLTQTAVSGVVDAIFQTIADTVAKGGKVTIPGWLSAEITKTSARTGRNPQTGATIQIPAGQRVKVSAGSKLKAAAK